MSDRPSILVPVRVLEGESLSEGVPEVLANAHVVLLGYHEVPDQTATDQAQAQFEDQATQRLDELQEILEDAGATVDRVLVFTHDAQATIDRMNTEHDILAVLVPAATTAVEDVLVAIRGTVGIDRIARVVTGLFGGTDASVTLYHVVEDDETEADVQTLFDGMIDRLVERGLDADAIDTRIEHAEDTQGALVEATDGCDVLIMGESDPSLKTLVFGMRADRVADQFYGPVFVVQHEPPANDEP